MSDEDLPACLRTYDSQCKLRTLLHEVLVGMRNAPVARAKQLLKEHGFEFPDTTKKGACTYAELDEDLHEAFEMLKISELAADCERETSENGAYASYEPRKQALLVKYGAEA